MKLISEWTLNCKHKRQRLTFCQILKKLSQNLRKLSQNFCKNYYVLDSFGPIVQLLCSKYVCAYYNEVLWHGLRLD